MAPEITANFPEVEAYTRILSIGDLLIQHHHSVHTIDHFLATDDSFFDLFSFNLIHGNHQTALNGPNKIVLTEKTAQRVFNGIDVVGKSIQVNGGEHYLVTGIVKDPPQNSHIKFNGLISLATILRDHPCKAWDCNYSFYSYLLLDDNSDQESLETKLPDFLWEPLNKKNAEFGWREDMKLIPLKDIHFHSTSNSELETPGSTTMIVLFAVIAIMIITVAGINFVNLTTAQASRKGKEIGIKKVIGASKRQLLMQQFGEVFTQAFIAIIIAVIFLELALPSFNNLLQINLEVSYIEPIYYLGIFSLLLLISLATGLSSGLYFSKLNPLLVLKSKLALSSKRSKLRNALLVVQFTVSIALIASTLIIYKQLNYLTAHDLGFDKENIINIILSNEEAQGQWKTLKSEISGLSEVISVGASTFVPGGGTTSNGYVPEGLESPMMIRIIDIDQDFLETHKISIEEGRNFSEEFPSDKKAFIINETLARTLNWDQAIGRYIERNGTKHEVIGVVRDFNFSSLHNQLEPIILSNEPWEGMMDFTFLSVKLKTNNLQKSMQKMEGIWNSQVSTLPFEFSFLEDRLNDQYQNEQRLGKAFLYFSGLAILISCMGLFGVVLFMTEQKTKEIGIRKALGGSVIHILLLLSNDLTKWIVLSMFIAIPIAWITMEQWLMNFAYAIKIQWWIFLLAGMVTIILSWLTISWHSIKAALKKPVDTLRYE